jgi:hypothetical protein
MRIALPALLLAVGCSDVPRPPPEGIAVGNPTNSQAMSLRVTGGLSLAVESGTWAAEVDVLEDSGAVQLFDGTLDLVASPPLNFTSSAWEGLRFDGARKLKVDGENETGAQVHVVLDLPGLELILADPPADMAYVTELGGPDWLDLSTATGDPIVITPGSPEHDTLVAAFVAGSSIYADEDGDGELSDDERVDALATGSLYEDPRNDAGAP